MRTHRSNLFKKDWVGILGAELPEHIKVLAEIMEKRGNRPMPEKEAAALVEETLKKHPYPEDGDGVSRMCRTLMLANQIFGAEKLPYRLDLYSYNRGKLSRNKKMVRFQVMREKKTPHPQKKKEKTPGEEEQIANILRARQFCKNYTCVVADCMHNNERCVFLLALRELGSHEE